MKERPRLKIELTTVDKMIETACLTILILLWVGTIAFFSYLPDRIATHYNAAGEADGFGHKSHLFFLPIVATLIYVGITLLNKHPHLYNYPATITKENAKRLYTSAAKLIRVLKLTVVIIFSGIVFMTYKTSLTNCDQLGGWFLPVAIALLILPNIFYLLKSSDVKKISK